MLPSGGARDTLCGQSWNHKSQSSTALGQQRLDIKHAKQQHFAKHIFCMFTKSLFSWYPLWDAVIYIEIVVNINENSIKWKKIFTRLLSIAFPLSCNDDASCRERFVNMTKLHHLRDLHHHMLHNKTRDLLPSISSTILHVRDSEHANSKSVQSSPIWWYRKQGLLDLYSIMVP